MQSIHDGETHASPPALTQNVKGNSKLVFFLLCLGFFFSCSTVIIFAVIPNYYVDLLHLSGMESSFLSASPLVSTAALSLPASAIARHWGSRLLVSSAAAISGLALLLTAATLYWSTNFDSLYTVFVLIGLLAGCGTATIPAGVLSLSWWWPEDKHGIVIGGFLFSTVLGPAIFGSFAEPMIQRTGVATFYVFWSTLVLVSMLALLFSHDPPYLQLQRSAQRRNLTIEPLPSFATTAADHQASHNVDAPVDVSQQQLRSASQLFGQMVFPDHSLTIDLVESTKRLNSWCLFGIASVSLGAFLGFVIWLPSFFIGVFDIAGESAGLILLGYSCCGSLGCLIGGWAADHTSVWIGSITSLSVACTMNIVLAVSTSQPLSVGAAIIAGAASITANTYCFKIVLNLCPDCCAGTIGFMETGGNFIGLLLPLVWGAIASKGSPYFFRMGMFVPAALLAIAIVLLALLYWNARSSESQEAEALEDLEINSILEIRS